MLCATPSGASRQGRPEAVGEFWSLDLPDGGRLTGTRFGDAAHVVLLLHGMRYEQTSWHPFAARLVAAGCGALTLDFRGYGASSPRPEPTRDAADVAQAVERLWTEGANEVSLLGGSMGGAAALQAAALQGARVDRIAVLSPAVDAESVALVMSPVPLLVLASEGEPLAQESIALKRLRPETTELHLYPGDAHAQRLLAGPHQSDVEERLLRFLR